MVTKQQGWDSIPRRPAGRSALMRYSLSFFLFCLRMLFFKAIMDNYALCTAELQGDTQLYYVITGFPRISKHSSLIFHSNKLNLYIISSERSFFFFYNLTQNPSTHLFYPVTLYLITLLVSFITLMKSSKNTINLVATY